MVNVHHLPKGNFELEELSDTNTLSPSENCLSRVSLVQALLLFLGLEKQYGNRHKGALGVVSWFMA